MPFETFIRVCQRSRSFGLNKLSLDNLLFLTINELELLLICCLQTTWIRTYPNFCLLLKRLMKCLLQIGLMGLVEEEWIDTLSTVDPADVTFEDFVQVGNQLEKELRNEVTKYVSE